MYMIHGIVLHGEIHFPSHGFTTTFPPPPHSQSPNPNPNPTLNSTQPLQVINYSHPRNTTTTMTLRDLEQPSPATKKISLDQGGTKAKRALESVNVKIGGASLGLGLTLNGSSPTAELGLGKGLEG